MAKAVTEVKSATRLRDLAQPGGQDILMFFPRDLKIEPGHNPRDYALKENRDHLDNLKRLIKRGGVKRPLDVRFSNADPTTKPPTPAQAIVMDGECRLRACLELLDEGELDAKTFKVPVKQTPGKNEKDRLIHAFIANTGKSLSTWETGGTIKRLLGYGMSEQEIADELGLTMTYVKQAVVFSDAPEEVKQQLSAQAVTPQLAIIHIKKHGDKAGKTLAKAAAEAKAKGKKTATAERTIGVNAWEALGKQIAKRLETEGETDAITEKKAEGEYVALPYTFAKKLLDLHRGIKPAKSKK